jgi:hypothetical protein
MDSERRAFSRPDWAPAGVDVDTPNVARIYDYLLGGMHNFEVDRAFAEKVIAACPIVQKLAVRNRRFLMTAVRVLAAEHGAWQFLDLGAGIPSSGAVHDIVRQVNPNAQVVYVDNEAVSVAYGELMVEGIDGVEYVDADFTRAADVLTHKLVRTTLDFTQPVVVISCATLHLVPDVARPKALVDAYRRATVPGSHLVISHGTMDNCPEMADLAELYQQANYGYFPRDRVQFEELLDGYDLLPPGVAMTAGWRPDMLFDAEDVARSGCYAAVGRRL